MLSSDRAAPVTRGLVAAGSVRVTLAGLTRGRTSSVVHSRAAVAGSGLFTVLLTSPASCHLTRGASSPPYRRA